MLPPTQSLASVTTTSGGPVAVLRGERLGDAEPADPAPDHHAINQSPPAALGWEIAGPSATEHLIPAGVQEGLWEWNGRMATKEEATAAVAMRVAIMAGGGEEGATERCLAEGGGSEE
ncbi:hypothetical protein NL676_038887 [Syzygium grande]|nr:hypothetical protein NL676_038887 [Syzygium grande]